MVVPISSLFFEHESTHTPTPAITLTDAHNAPVHRHTLNAHIQLCTHTFVKHLENRAIEPYIQVTGLHYMHMRGHIVLAPVALEALVTNT